MLKTAYAKFLHNLGSTWGLTLTREANGIKQDMRVNHSFASNMVTEVWVFVQEDLDPIFMGESKLYDDHSLGLCGFHLREYDTCLHTEASEFLVIPRVATPIES